MKKIILLIALLAFAGCSHHKKVQPNLVEIKKTKDVKTNLTVKQFKEKWGIKDKYTNSEEQNIAILKKVQKDLANNWKYLLDSDKYTDEKDAFDYHTSLAREYKLLKEAKSKGLKGQEVVDYIYDANGETNNVRVIGGVAYLVGDCNQFQSTLNALLIASGINPLRLNRVFAMVYGNPSMTTNVGGHAFAQYISKSGKCISLEQLPLIRSCKYTITGVKADWDEFGQWSFPDGSYYKYRSYSNVMWDYGKFNFFTEEARYKMKNDIPIILKLGNE